MYIPNADIILLSYTANLFKSSLSVEEKVAIASTVGEVCHYQDILSLVIAMGIQR